MKCESKSLLFAWTYGKRNADSKKYPVIVSFYNWIFFVQNIHPVPIQIRESYLTSFFAHTMSMYPSNICPTAFANSMICVLVRG